MNDNTTKPPKTKQIRQKNKKSIHYVDNTEFFNAMVEYRNQVLEAKATGAPKPRVSDYIGECLLKIATRLSHKSNFASYTYRDDMISDSLENCLVYIDNFNPEKTQNPFTYFTTIIFWAFVRRIQREKTQQYIKYKSMENSLLYLDEPVPNHTGSGKKAGGSTEEVSRNFMQEFIEKFETARASKKKKATPEVAPEESALDEFLNPEAIAILPEIVEE